MNALLFKTKLKVLLELKSSQNAKETANAIGTAYDDANKSFALNMFGQKLISGNTGKLFSYLQSGFELNEKLKDESEITEEGWIQIARGFIWYWDGAIFQDTPPPPGIIPKPNAVSVKSPFEWTDRIKVGKKIKSCFSEGSIKLNIDSLINVLFELHETIKGDYVGITQSGAPSPPQPWVGVFGKKIPKKENKKSSIKKISTSDWIPIIKPQDYTIKFIDGVWRGNISGKYAARFDSRGKIIIPSVNQSELRKADQINGRLSLDLLVQIEGEEGLLEKNAGNAYLKMKQDALKDGVSITFNSKISGYRPLGRPGDLKLRKKQNQKHFTQWSQREDYNECLFDNGWNINANNQEKNRALKFCARDFAMPAFVNYGTSNHGWGRAVDIGSKDNPKLEAQKWIRENGWKYGWYWGEQPDEEWHFTWVLDGYVPPDLDVGTFYIRNSLGEIDPSDV